MQAKFVALSRAASRPTPAVTGCVDSEELDRRWGKLVRDEVFFKAVADAIYCVTAQNAHHSGV